ncbi:hypothetical protein OYC64_019055 [Pagothenia borchgrevinki]|uniref:Uncharacterized protein n=1 Tax=Pagothenia borchgrevinki TaxID=8213 RepID=A0ABD2GRL2_PAGBO
MESLQVKGRKKSAEQAPCGWICVHTAKHPTLYEDHPLWGTWAIKGLDETAGMDCYPHNFYLRKRASKSPPST